MPNPILVFLDLSRFGKPPGWRTGVRPDGAVEAIDPAVEYSLILLGDRDPFGELSFQHNREEATLGVEHGSWPIDDARKTGLTNICDHYERVCTFSHTDNNDIFKCMQAFFAADDDPQRTREADKIIVLIKSLDRWNGLVQFLMNEQIGLLGGTALDIMELPRSAVEFKNELEDNDGSYAKIIDDFLSSSPPA